MKRLSKGEFFSGKTLPPMANFPHRSNCFDLTHPHHPNEVPVCLQVDTHEQVWVRDDEPLISTHQMLWGHLFWFTFDWTKGIHSMVVFGRRGCLITQSYLKRPKIKTSIDEFLAPEIDWCKGVFQYSLLAACIWDQCYWSTIPSKDGPTHPRSIGYGWGVAPWTA